MTPKTSWAFALVAALLMVPAPVAAYLDPGTSGTILQTALALFAATAATAGIYWRATRDMFRRILRGKPDGNLPPT